MKTLAYQSAYLVAAPKFPSSRLTLQIWRHSLRPRRLPLKTITGLASWLVVLAVIGWSHSHHTLRVPAALATSTQSAAPTPVPGLATLAGGPIGGLLPPGTLASYGTYHNDYDPGQCTWYVASRRQVPDHWGNANSWLSAAQRAGWNTGTVPAVGAIAWTNAGYYGHVAVVEAVSGTSVEVAEMNYVGPYQIDHRWTPYSNWRYIY